MQNRSSLCCATSSELVFRHSYLGDLLVTKGSPAVDLKKFPPKSFHSRRISNDSISSEDSGIGFTKADYEIQRAIRAHRVQRPRIIVLHKGKPVYQNHEEADANLVLKAAVASRRHRREIAVMQQRSSFILEVEKCDAPVLKSDDTIDISSESNKNDMPQDNYISKLITNSSVEDEETRLSVTPEGESDSPKESKVNVISEESNGTKTNNFISEEKINTPRPLAIATHNSSIVKKVTKSIKKFLGLKKERGRNSVMPIYKFLKKKSLRKDIEEK